MEIRAVSGVLDIVGAAHVGFLGRFYLFFGSALHHHQGGHKGPAGTDAFVCPDERRLHTFKLIVEVNPR